MQWRRSGLTVPAVALVSLLGRVAPQLGISAGATVLMTLGFAVAMITYGTGRTNLLSGIVHLVLLTTYVFSSLCSLSEGTELTGISTRPPERGLMARPCR